MNKTGKIVIGSLVGLTTIAASVLIVKKMKNKSGDQNGGNSGSTQFDFDWVGRQRMTSVADVTAPIVAGLHLVGVADAADYFAVGDKINITLSDGDFSALNGEHRVVGLYNDEGTPNGMIRVEVQMQQGQTAKGTVKKI